MAEPSGARDRGRRRRSRRQDISQTVETIRQLPFEQPTHRYQPLNVVSDDELEAVHQASLTILSEIGIDFLHEEAKSILKEAGADVEPDGDRVRFDPALVDSFLGLAPEVFTLHARNPVHNLQFGGDKMAVCSIASPPNASDLTGGRRTGSQEDYRTFLKLGQSLNAVHLWGGYPVEPADIHPSVRHLDALYDMLVLSDKAVHAYSLGKERNRDAIELVKLARNIDDETLMREPSVITVINASSPLRHDTPMMQGILEMARLNQPVILTPFTLAGAMAPVTLAGAVAQQNAEALAGLVLTQAVNKGSPFIYGSFTSNVDMRSGAPAFGTPEFMKTTLLSG